MHKRQVFAQLQF